MYINTKSSGTNIADSSTATRDKTRSEEHAATAKKSTGPPSARSSKDSPVAPSKVRRWLAKVLPADRVKGLLCSFAIHAIIAIVLAMWALPVMDKSVIPILLTESDLSEELEEIEAVLPAEGWAPGEIVPVHLQAAVTEVGTLRLDAVSRSGDERWKVELNVRGED